VAYVERHHQLWGNQAAWMGESIVVWNEHYTKSIFMVSFLRVRATWEMGINSSKLFMIEGC
jgi:hypothetical protein